MVNHSDVLGPPNWKDISSLASLNAKQLLTRYASVHTMQRPFPYWDPATDVELGKLLGNPVQYLASLSGHRIRLWSEALVKLTPKGVLFSFVFELVT